MPLCVSVYMCLLVTYLERTDLLALVCGFLLLVCHFPIGILGKVWYLIVSIPDFCTLTYLVKTTEDIKPFVSETLVYLKSWYGFDNFEMLSVIIINLMT